MQSFEFKNREGKTERAKVTEQNELLIIHLPGSSRALPVLKPPVGTDESSAAWPVVAAAVAHVLTLADITQSKNGDELLSSLGRSRALEPFRKTAIDGVRRMVENAHNLQQGCATRLAELFSIPAVSSPVDVATDREIRDRWHSATSDERTKLLMEILNNSTAHARIADALARSPYPLAHANADSAIRESRENTVRELRPISVAKAELDLAGAKWAVSVLPHVAEAAANVAAIERGALFDMIDGQDAAPLHVLSAFGFRNPSEVVMLRQRRAAA